MGKKRTQRAIDHWLKTGSNKLLLTELPFMEKIWKERSEDEKDLKSGVETYGYGNPKEVRATMEYISDRWMCAFRLKWIIDGLRCGKI